MKTPTTFTEQDARTMLDLAEVHTLSFNPATQQYVCTIQIDRWSPVVVGTGPRMQDAVWAACIAATDAAMRPGEI
jgi:uncharacterized protein YcgI (DUF1989 family)